MGTSQQTLPTLPYYSAQSAACADAGTLSKCKVSKITTAKQILLPNKVLKKSPAANSCLNTSSSRPAAAGNSPLSCFCKSKSDKNIEIAYFFNPVQKRKTNCSKKGNQIAAKKENDLAIRIICCNLMPEIIRVMSYLKRISDQVLAKRLEAFGAVLIEGPKWCGKTTTAEQQAKSVIKMQDPDMSNEYFAAVESKPSLLLLGETPRLIDEWQDAPVLWDAVRTMVDKRQAVGQFILTGSNTVKKDKIRHSGTGRISRMKMLPMSLYESKESNGKISLSELFDNPNLDIDGIMSDMEITDLIFSACRGGWPASVNIKSREAQLLIAQNYVDTVCKEDISRIDDIKRDEFLTRQILKSYSRNISTLAKNTSILEDVVASGEVSCSKPTFEDYVDALTRLFVIDNIPAWCPAIRSKTSIRSGLKRSFVDPSIAVATLGLSPEALMTQLKTFGFIFEQMCVRDLRAYTPDFNSHISYYRDRHGLEADLVLHLSDGRYALIECKLGNRDIEAGAEHLNELKRLIQVHNKEEQQVPLREPDLLIILTGGEMAYTRPDGVKIIPLACLKD